MNKKKVMVRMGAFLALSVCLGMGSMQAQAADGDTISKGVTIGGVDVSGMTGEEAQKAVEEQVDSLKDANIILKAGENQVQSTAEDLGMSWKNEEVVEEAAGLGKSGNIVKRYKDKKDLENEGKAYDITFTADKSRISSFLESHHEELDNEAVNGSLTRENGEFQVVAGVPGVQVNVSKSADAVVKYLNSEWKGEDATVDLVVETQEPIGSAEELSMITDVLGTATTYYGSTVGRNQNVENGAAKLNGHVIYPGENFSVTAAVVPFDEANGYALAASYESGQVVDTYGGGICQVSTTLYNAVLKAELNVTERHNHTMSVSYVDPSKDAAIAEGLMDFQFENDSEYPVYIEGYGYGGELTFTIYGHETRPADRVVEFVSETTSTTPVPAGVALYGTYDQSVGYLAQSNSGRTGSEAVLWKVVTENGETTRTQVNSSSYQATPIAYQVGLAGASDATLAALQSAISNNDLNGVQAAMSGNYGGTTTQTESQAQTQYSETQATEAPVTEAPVTEAPATEAPVTEAPATEAPVTEAPVTEAPVTEAPVTEAPVIDDGGSVEEVPPDA